MAIGKFDETNEKNETNEAKEATDNNEKKRNQILDTPEDYDDDFDKKLDENENKESKDQPKEASEEKGDDKEKNSIMDKLRNLFSKKENNDDKGESKEESDKKDDGHHTEAENSFRDKIKVDTPIKVPEGGEEYKKAREESDKANEEYPDRKSWELTPEKLEEIRDGQQAIAKKYNSENDET